MLALPTQNDVNPRGHEAGSTLWTGLLPAHGFLILLGLPLGLSVGSAPRWLANLLQLFFINIFF